MLRDQSFFQCWHAAAAATAARESEQFLAEFCKHYQLLEPDLGAFWFRQALHHLVVVGIETPVAAQPFISRLAKLTSTPKRELKREVQLRAEFFKRFSVLLKANRERTTEQVCLLLNS